MNVLTLLKKIDYWSAKISRQWGMHLLRYSLSVIYIWFGILKPLGLSPASGLVEQSIFWFSSEWFVPVLGIWEVVIGLMLLFKPTVRYAVLMIYVHLICTFIPFISLPESAMVEASLQLTLVGQYIIKNLTLFVAAIIIGGSLNKEQIEKEPSLKINSQKNDQLLVEKELAAV